MLPPGSNNHRALFVEGLGGRVGVARLSTQKVERVAGHPDQCPPAKVCHGAALP